jgi:cell division inhibitor SulA
VNKAHQFQQHEGSESSRCGITELIFAQGSLAALLMPMLAFISQSCEDRWVTWVAPQSMSREFLQAFGVDTRFLRLIHCADESRLLWVTWEALAAGNSHTVIASPGKLTEKEIKHLETAAAKGKCQGLLLRAR